MVNFWIEIYDYRQFDLEAEMKAAVNYQENRRRESLEAAANSQHEQWKDFVKTYQQEIITQDHEKFRKEKYEQFQTDYANLEEKIKDQDRLNVRVISDVILGLADVNYKRQIDTSKTFE